jgi:hypothetical protein
LIAFAPFLVAVSPASADPIGTFRWRLAPFCNVVTLDAVGQATTISVTGTDDQCGAPVAATATGAAHVNPNGTITLSLQTTRDDGYTIATSVQIDPATLSGVWKDDSGNSGTFLFNPPAAPGEPRRITLTGVYSAGLSATQAGQGVISNISFPRTLPAPPAVPEANIIPFGAVPTANCPGSYDAPRALPGQLCLYERLSANIADFRITNSEGDEGVADTTGAHFVILAAAPEALQVVGKWAVTIP